MALEAGSPIGTQLRLKEPMGSGATGTVWRAEHRGLDADVAVKIMRGDAHLDPTAALRFSEEARAAAHINHPNVLKVFDRGMTDDGDRYIVMELLEGESLRGRLARGPLSRSEAIHVVLQVAKALDAAHQRGVVHRDLKPANIFLCKDEELPFVKILDFGVAKRLGEDALMMTTEGALLGTPPYMSPEQFAGVPVDARTDLWSLGIVTYEVLAGRRPFLGGSLAELIVAVEDGTFPPLGDLVPGLPSAVDEWIHRALEADANQRFASAAEMLKAWRAAWSLPSTNPSARSSVRPPFASDVDVGAPTVPDRPLELPTAQDVTVEESRPAGGTVVEEDVAVDTVEQDVEPEIRSAPSAEGAEDPRLVSTTSAGSAIVELEGVASVPAGGLPRRGKAWMVAMTALGGVLAFLVVRPEPALQAEAWGPPVPSVSVRPDTGDDERPSEERADVAPSATASSEAPPPTIRSRPPVRSSEADGEVDQRTDAAGERLGI